MENLNQDQLGDNLINSLETTQPIKNTENKNRVKKQGNRKLEKNLIKILIDENDSPIRKRIIKKLIYGENKKIV
tara:strand:- start:651 stop:872 length:222 start_codon:yes stop_codon:yes gene_type:complete